MLFYKQRRKIFRYFRFLNVVLKTSTIFVKNKTVFFDISGIAINRYLYTFLKMFQMQGYSVFIPKSIEIANILTKDEGEFKYASWLISEKVVKFGKPSEVDLEFTANQLSNDYFNSQNSGYRVPMSCYPWYYKNYARFENLIVNEDRKKSIFMSGNIDKKYYDRISDSKYFSSIPSRKKTADFLRTNSSYYRLKSNDELNKFLENKIDNKIIIIDSSQDFRIDLEELPSILNKFTFYLALPGITIPQSHNLTEAMFCGCLIVIHKKYAELLDPPLESFTNAIIYNSLEELQTMIPSILKLKDSEIKEMRGNVIAYYNAYLSSQAIVKNVLENPEKIFIQAEHISLK